MALFARVLGADFDMLPPAVQRLHRAQGLRRYHGEVEVERGHGLLSRILAAATRLPPAGTGPMRVDIQADWEEERWTRRIGGHAMPSRLWETRGLLCERLGLARFGFRLHAQDDAILWRVARASVFGIPLPATWFRDVVARESGQDGRYHFDVRAAMPVIGLLVHYRGWLHVE